MTDFSEVRGPSLARNTVLNLAGSGLPVIVGVLTIPFIIRGLGTERFGVLSLAWVVLTYFSIFDFGLGRATVKFVSEALGQNAFGRIPPLVWTSLISQLVLGIIGGSVLAGLTPFGVDRVLRISPSLRVESRETFYIFSAAVPVGICALCLRGVLEAAQRFDLVNAIKIPFNSLVFLMPALGVAIGFNLRGIAILLLLTQLVSLGVYFLTCFYTLPFLRKGFSIQTSVVRPLLGYGGWVAGSDVIIPVTTYVDRFLIGILRSVGTVPYFTVPYDIMQRAQVLPQSLATSLFPAFSSLGTERKDEVGRLCVKSMKYLLMVLGPITAGLVLFGGDILRLWLGGDFAQKSTLVFQILVMGSFLNSMAWPPGTVLSAMGRPDLVTKVYIVLLVLHVGLAWLMIEKMGLIGAALAVVVREGLQLFLYFLASWKSNCLSLSGSAENGLIRAGIASGALLAVLSFLILARSDSGLIRVALMVGVSLAFLMTIFRYVLDACDLADLNSSLTRIKDKLKVVK